MNLNHFMNNPRVTEHLNKWAIVEKRFYVSIDHCTCCSGDKNPQILFRACNLRFVFLHTVLSISCSKSHNDICQNSVQGSC